MEIVRIAGFWLDGAWMAPAHPDAGYVAELTKIADVELVDLPTGHWPQFTRPRALANAILAPAFPAESA